MADSPTKSVEEQATEVVEKAKNGEKIELPLTQDIEDAARRKAQYLEANEKKRVIDALDQLRKTVIISDPLGKLAQDKLFEEDIRKNLEEQLKSMDGKLDKMSPQELENALNATENILNIQWIENIPGMKEKAREILHYQPMINGIVGATLIKKLQKLGYSLFFSASNQVKVVSNQPDAREIETKFNTHLAKSTVLTNALQSGILYLNPSFESYRKSVSDTEGKFTDPSQVSMKTYEKFLQSKSLQNRDIYEKMFLQSARYYDSSFDFQKTLLQSKEYPKVIGLMEQVTKDPSVRELLPNGTVRPDVQNTPQNTLPSDPNSLAGQAGKGIGQLGGIAGKIAGAGASGGARVVMDMLTEATKTGGAWGALAVIGGLIFSIWKGGFWKTLGGLFGIGLADAASRGELGGLTGNHTNKPNAATLAPSNNNTSALAAAAGAGSIAPSATPALSPETPTTKPLTENALIARALGRDNIHESNIDTEKNIFTVMGGVNFITLQTALSKNDEPSWKAVKDALKYDTMDAPMKEKVDKILDPKDTSSREILIKIVSHLSGNTHVLALSVEDRQKKTLGQMMQYVIDKENEKKPEEKPTTKPPALPPLDTFTLSDGHSNLYLLSRLITQGYIPQLSDNVWSSKDQPFHKRTLSGIAYFAWDGGPLTNNKDSKNPLVGAWHNGLQKRVGEYALAATQDEKSMITQSLEAMKAKNIDSKALIEAELLERKGRVDAIENALKKQPFDLKELQTAMASYEKSVKTKWEIIGNKLGMKIGANGWNIFKSADAEAYVRKAEGILDSEKKKWLGDSKIWTMEEGRNFIDNQIRINGSYNVHIDGVAYDITGKTKDGRYTLVNNVDQTGHYFNLEEIISSRNKQVIEEVRLEKTNEAIKLGEEIDAKKQAVLDKFTAWDADKASVEKQKAAMAALEDYNKRVIDVNGKISDNFALLTEAQAKELSKKLPKSGWLSEFIADNTKGTQFGWADKVDAWTAGTKYVKGARRGFVGVGLLSIAYNSGGGFTDLVKDGKIGTAMTRILDLGIGMVPFVGAIHDATILSFEDYEQWMLGAKMSEEERNMRKAMIVLGMIPGVGLAVKGAGNIAKSGTMLAVGGTVLKSGNLIRSVATYGMLGMSIVHTTFDIQGKISK